VDTERALPAGYGPGDLHDVAEAGFSSTGALVRRLVIEDLRSLRDAAAANGTPIGILDGYRSFQAQTELFENRTSSGDGYETGSRILRPGHSEHQLGTVIDVAGEGQAEVDATWGSSPTGQWVAANGYKYGFVLSYPRDATEQTCFEAEPWHLRYVGRERAQAVIDSGLTVREHLWRLSQGLDPNAAG
jgi:D-alanyl-D-alanine carboxypeptidase